MNELFEESLKPLFNNDGKPSAKVLHTWVKELLKWDLHKTVRCLEDKEHESAEGYPHCSQLDYVMSCYFEQHSSSVFIANRGGGKSKSASVCIVLDSWFRPNLKSAVLGWKEEQSLYIWHHIVELMGNMADSLGCDIKQICTIRAKHITFFNGAQVRFFTGQGRGNIKGYHPERLWVDEVDLFNFDEFDGLGNALVSTKVAESQFNLLSTSYQMSEDSVVLQMEQSFLEFNKSKPAHMKPNKAFRICLLDVLETCDSRYECHNPVTKQQCMLWEYCQGQAKTIKGGFYPIDEAMKNLMRQGVSKRGFDAQMMLKTPVADDAYFPSFSIKDHVLVPDRELDTTLKTLVGLDFGGIRCPHAMLLVQKDTDGTFYVIDELESEKKTYLPRFIEQVKRRYPNITSICQGCYIDPAGFTPHMNTGENYAKALREAGFFPKGTTKCKRDFSFDLLLTLIDPASGEPKLKVNKRCKNLIREIQQAQRVKNSTGKDKPLDGKGDDLLDCLRYIIWWNTGNRGVYKPLLTPIRR